MVEFPAGDTFRVAANQRSLAGRDAQLVQIVPGLVAIVEADENHVGIAFGHGIDSSLHTLRIREIPRSRDIRPRLGQGAGLDRIDVEILVAFVILGVQDVFSVAGPEVCGDGPLGFRGEGPRSREWRVRLLHPDVARTFVGLDKRDVLAVWREFSSGDLDFAEDRIAVY